MADPIEDRLDRIEATLKRILALQSLADPSIGEAALGTRSTYSAPCSTKSIGTACNIGGTLTTPTATPNTAPGRPAG